MLLKLKHEKTSCIHHECLKWLAWWSSSSSWKFQQTFGQPAWHEITVTIPTSLAPASMREQYTTAHPSLDLDFFTHKCHLPQWQQTTYNVCYNTVNFNLTCLFFLSFYWQYIVCFSCNCTQHITEWWAGNCKDDIELHRIASIFYRKGETKIVSEFFSAVSVILTSK